MTTQTRDGDRKTVAAKKKRRARRRHHAVRIDAELFELAEEAAARNHRSVPKQLEYWAQLGSVIAPGLTPKDVDDLLTRDATLQVQPNESD